MSDLDIRMIFEKYGGWLLIILFSAVPVIFWFSINQVSSEFSTNYGKLSSMGKLFGLVGFMLYAINLLLAVRRRWLESFFGGLNRVYIAHHITGAVALAFVAFHPMFLALRSIDLKLIETFGEAAKFLWWRPLDSSLSYLEVQDAVSINAGIVAFWGMVALLVLTLFVKLPYRFWLFTHRFLGVAFVFALLHILTISSDTSQSALLKWYLIIWGLIGLGAYLYRTIFGNVVVRREPYKIDRIMAQDTITMMELIPMQHRLQFKPGQFVFIRFLWSSEDGVIPEAHPFSIASGSSEDKLRLYVRALGDFTSSLHGLKPGAVAEIEGAFGRFTPARYGTIPQIWIAGGIGITPFLSMARSLKDMPQQIQLVYSVKTKSELVEGAILKDFLPSHFKNFQFIPYITDEEDGKFLTADIIEGRSGGLIGKEIFLCGPPPMMKSLREQLRKKGVKNTRIHSEEFSMQ